MAFGKKEKKPGTSATGNVTIYTDGLVHATIQALSLTAIGDAWIKGDELDATLVDMQSQGAEILSVAPYGLGDGKTARVVIVYRAPSNSYAL